MSNRITTMRQDRRPSTYVVTVGITKEDTDSIMDAVKIAIRGLYWTKTPTIYNRWTGAVYTIGGNGMKRVKAPNRIRPLFRQERTIERNHCPVTLERVAKIADEYVIVCFLHPCADAIDLMDCYDLTSFREAVIDCEKCYTDEEIRSICRDVKGME